MLLVNGNCTEQSIVHLRWNKLQVYDILVTNYIAFSTDNAAVMIGKKNDITSFLSQKRDSIVIRCVCHLIKFSFGKWADFISLNIDELLIGIFFLSGKKHKEKKKITRISIVLHKNIKTCCNLMVINN